mmetsp:Transcript_4918/g.12260  ORF Transcript_4918/g.12260 Transcript_4918/m.12260 type:complete len:303 (+) Transcript_4918:1179-2087(+)
MRPPSNTSPLLCSALKISGSTSTASAVSRIRHVNTTSLPFSPAGASAEWLAHTTPESRSRPSFSSRTSSWPLKIWISFSRSCCSTFSAISGGSTEDDADEDEDEPPAVSLPGCSATAWVSPAVGGCTSTILFAGTFRSSSPWMMVYTSRLFPYTQITVSGFQIRPFTKVPDSAKKSASRGSPTDKTPFSVLGSSSGFITGRDSSSSRCSSLVVPSSVFSAAAPESSRVSARRSREADRGLRFSFFSASSFSRTAASFFRCSARALMSEVSICQMAVRLNPYDRSWIPSRDSVQSCSPGVSTR